jgi:hypothetical protein
LRVERKLVELGARRKAVGAEQRDEFLARAGLERKFAIRNQAGEVALGIDLTGDDSGGRRLLTHCA